MTANLAGILTDSAARDADRIALKLDDAEVSYASSTRAARASPGCCASAGSRRATASGSCSRTSRTSRSSTTASCALGGGRGADERAAQGPRGRVLPARTRGRRSCSRGTASPRRPSTGAEEAGADVVIVVEPGEFEKLARGRRARARGRRPRRRRHRGDPLHVGHDRHAEGRRAHARQPAPQRRGLLARPVRHRPRRRRARRAAALSLLRPDVRAERARSPAARC